MDKDKVIDYVMNSPANTNRAVLEGMLGDTDGVKLPEINEEDEGKVLTVIDGKWDKGVASGGGASPLIVNVSSVTEEEIITHTLDKTWQQIRDAFPNVILQQVTGVNYELWIVQKVMKGRGYTVLDGLGHTYNADAATDYPSYTSSTQPK